MSRDAIRAALFNQKPRTIEVTAAGVKLEMRQPSINEMLSLLDIEDKKAQIVFFLIQYCYVPGTNEKVFEPSDQESLLAMPSNATWARLQAAFSELTDLDAIDESVGNS